MAFKTKINDASRKRIQKKLEALTRPMTKASTKKMGQEVIAEMKNLIGKGVSPITGKRFPKYKKSYRDQIKKYHSKKYGKKNTPINLKLTGDFLKDLSSRVISKGKLNLSEIFFKTELSEKKEEGHRKGANRQRKRPILPKGKEKFAQRIQNILILFTRDAVRKIIRKR